MVRLVQTDNGRGYPSSVLDVPLCCTNSIIARFFSALTRLLIARSLTRVFSTHCFPRDDLQ